MKASFPLKPRHINQLLVGFSLFFAATISLHAVDYYYSGTGNVNSVANWFTNRNGTGSNPANFTTAGNSFIIQNAQAPTLGGAWTISGIGSNLLIETGGSLNTGLNNPTLTLNMQSGASYVMANSTYTNLTIGSLNAVSNFDYRASSSGVFRPAFTYGNILWNYTVGSDTPGDVTTLGSITNNTGGTRELRVATGSTSSRTWNIGQDIINQSGVLNLNNGTSTVTATINLQRNLINTGTITKGANAAAINFNGSTASNVTWGTVTNTNFSNLTITVAAAKNLTFNDSLNAGAATFNVNGTLNIADKVLSGTSGNFSLASGATIITSNVGGLNGAITMTGSRTFSTGANYEFRGAGTGSLLPATVNNLTINRASGNVTLDGSGTTQTVNGALNLLSGNVAAGSTRNSITASSVTMRNSQINSSVTTTLGGNVSFDASNNGTAVIAGALNLGGSTRAFNIANGSASTDMEISGQITNGALTKSGLGALTLSGNNTYSGATTVSAGTLYVTGVLANSAVTVENGAAIGSNGTAATLGNGLTIATGGKLDLTGVTVSSNSTGVLSISSGNLTLGNLRFSDIIGWNWENASNGTYQLIAGDFTIDWGDTAYLDAASAYTFGNGKQGYFTRGSLNVVIIPEPRAALLGGLGLLLLLRRRRA